MITALKKIASAGLILLPTTAMADWNGRYAGLSFGNITDSHYEVSESVSSDGTAELSDSSVIGGFFGTMSQRDSFVFGFELALSVAPDADISDVVTIDAPITDLKGRFGYDLGDVLPYGVVGVASVSSTFGPNDINAAGLSFGVGVDYKLSDNFLIGAEYLARRTSEEFLDAQVDIDMDSFSIRAAYRF